ncbi:MAG: hypothetical protein EXR80_03770 [Methylococcales bacterium]|nr:hypothetical protein [Methylococcales bacterium]
MKATAEKMITVEQEFAIEHGDFTLFALFLRENSPELWDVIVSAPWIDENKEDGMNKVVAKINANLEKSELLTLTRVVIVEHDHLDLHELDRFYFTHSSQLIEVKNENLLGQEIKQAFFIPLKKAA